MWTTITGSKGGKSEMPQFVVGEIISRVSRLSSILFIGLPRILRESAEGITAWISDINAAITSAYAHILRVCN
jgi:hypothetical protein